MIKITNEIFRHQPRFANHCLFHPTDAVEDSWGKRILDTMAEDKSIGTVRIYNMLEDIVYRDADGNLCYDYRVNDLRLDYMLEKGYNIMLAYACVPECISNKVVGCSNSKRATRYKGKMFNTSTPSDYALWEEVCYQYTMHIIERYGIDVVSKWYLQCFNEPDCPAFFLHELGADDNPEAVKVRTEEYCKLYAAFEKGLRRASENLRLGGPTLAWHTYLLENFLNYVKDNNLKLDYIAVHNYGSSPMAINDGTGKLLVSNFIKKHNKYLDVIRRCGFGDTELVYDEWGAASHGFFNLEECPEFIFRETERFSAFYVKLIHDLILSEAKMSMIMICLSGQHEMTCDFSGFRNFFTLNFIRKPIYNAHCLAAKLGEELLKWEVDSDLFSIVPTQREDGSLSVLMTYCDDNTSDNIPDITETMAFENIKGKKVRISRIDKNTTNPYGEFLKMNTEDPTPEQLAYLREVGKIKPVEFIAESNELTLDLSSNAVLLIEVE